MCIICIYYFKSVAFYVLILYRLWENSGSHAWSLVFNSRAHFLFDFFFREAGRAFVSTISYKNRASGHVVNLGGVVSARRRFYRRKIYVCGLEAVKISFEKVTETLLLEAYKNNKNTLRFLNEPVSFFEVLILKNTASRFVSFVRCAPRHSFVRDLFTLWHKF